VVYDRHNLLQPRESTDIGIHTIRGGDIVGEHEVIFAGCGELIQVSHKATSKTIFAQGAISAMRFIITQKYGVYNMQTLINSL
jgi:4-hydroxy-tetrahydrodipicolinate reductase